MMAAMLAMTRSSSRATRQICRNRTVAATLLAPERGLALLDERLGCFLVVGGLSGAGVMDRFAIETGFQRQMFGIVDVALDIAERDRWSLRKLHRKLARGCIDLAVRYHLGHHAERQRVVRGEHRREQIELPRFRAAEQLGEKIGA